MARKPRGRGPLSEYQVRARYTQYHYGLTPRQLTDARKAAGERKDFWLAKGEKASSPDQNNSRFAHLLAAGMPFTQALKFVRTQDHVHELYEGGDHVGASAAESMFRQFDVDEEPPEFVFWYH